MANTVQVDFIGNPSQLFLTADEVEARLKRLGNVNAGAAVDKLTNSVKIAGPQVTNFGASAEASMKKAAAATDDLTKRTEKLTATQKRAAENAIRDAANVEASRNATIGPSVRDEPTAFQSPSPVLPSDEQFRRGRQLAAARAFGEEDKAQRAAAFESSKAKLAIYRAEKDSEVELEQKTQGRIKIVRGFGAIFRATGLTALGVNEAEINAAIQLYNNYGERAKAAVEAATVAANATKLAATAEATAVAATATSAESGAAAAVLAAGSAETAAGAATVASGEAVAAATAGQVALASLASVGVAGVVTSLAAVAAGALIVFHITKDIRDAEEQKLKLIVASEAARNKEIIAQKESLALTKQALSDAARQRELNDRLKTGDVDSLQRRFDLIKRLNELAPTGPNAENQRKELVDLANRIAAIPKEKTDAADKSFNQRFADNQKSQAEAADFQAKKAEEAKQKQIEADKKQQELFKNFKESVASLTVQLSSDNPFVKIWSDSDKALDSLRENLKGLKPQLASSVEALQKTLTARQEFTARLDSKLEAFSLRQRAQELRSPSLSADKAQEALARSERNFLFDNPNFAFLKQQEFENRRRDTRDPLSFNGQTFEAFLKQELDKTVPEFIRDPEGFAARKRLDDQIGIINANKAKTPFEQSINDQRLISLSSGLDPNKLNANERNQLAGALERRATEAERREIEGLSEAKNQSALLAQVRDEIAALRKQQGLPANGSTDLNIRLSDDTSDKKVTAVAATPNDVSRTYQLDIVGGTNR